MSPQITKTTKKALINNLLFLFCSLTLSSSPLFSAMLFTLLFRKSPEYLLFILALVSPSSFHTNVYIFVYKFFKIPEKIEWSTTEATLNLKILFVCDFVTWKGGTPPWDLIPTFVRSTSLRPFEKVAKLSSNNST